MTNTIKEIFPTMADDDIAVVLADSNYKVDEAIQQILSGTATGWMSTVKPPKEKEVKRKGTVKSKAAAPPKSKGDFKKVEHPHRKDKKETQNGEHHKPRTTKKENEKSQVKPKKVETPVEQAAPVEAAPEPVVPSQPTWSDIIKSKAATTASSKKSKKKKVTHKDTEHVEQAVAEYPVHEQTKPDEAVAPEPAPVEEPKVQVPIESPPVTKSPEPKPSAPTITQHLPRPSGVVLPTSFRNLGNELDLTFGDWDENEEAEEDTKQTHAPATSTTTAATATEPTVDATEEEEEEPEEEEGEGEGEEGEQPGNFVPYGWTGFPPEEGSFTPEMYPYMYSSFHGPVPEGAQSGQSQSQEERKGAHSGFQQKFYQNQMPQHTYMPQYQFYPPYYNLPMTQYQYPMMYNKGAGNFNAYNPSMGHTNAYPQSSGAMAGSPAGTTYPEEAGNFKMPFYQMSHMPPQQGVQPQQQGQQQGGQQGQQPAEGGSEKQEGAEFSYGHFPYPPYHQYMIPMMQGHPQMFQPGNMPTASQPSAHGHQKQW